MRWKIALRGLALVVCVGATTSVAIAGPLDDKSPAYFVNRYGPAKSSQTESSHGFLHVARGIVSVKGQFSVREFRKDNLRAQVVYFLPSLRLAAVNLQLKGSWTPEQVDAALKAYGGEWKVVDRGMAASHWVAPDGTVAKISINRLYIQSKEIVELTTRILAEEDAKRKEVPQF